MVWNLLCYRFLVTATATLSCVAGADAPVSWARHSWQPATARGASRIETLEEIISGMPTHVTDVQPTTTYCLPMRLPNASRIRVFASAIGLVGVPELGGGWSPLSFSAGEVNHAAAYAIWSQVVDKISPTYHVCVSTQTLHGCHALVTVVALAEPAIEDLPSITLQPFYPAVWAFERDHSHVKFKIDMNSFEDVQVSVTPLHSWQAEIKVFTTTDPRCSASLQEVSGEPQSSNTTSLDTIDISGASLRMHFPNITRIWICVDVVATVDWDDFDRAIFVVSAALRPGLGTFITRGLLAPGRLESGAEHCEHMRMLVRSDTNLEIVATPADGASLLVFASLAANLTRGQVTHHWNGTTPDGGRGASLVVRGDDVIENSAGYGAKLAEACLSISICRRQHEDQHSTQLDRARFWLTAVGESDVLTLEDGVPFSMAALPPAFADKKHDRVWRDFKYFVPGGAESPKEITITAISSGRARLVADTKSHPLDYRSYRWTSPSVTPVGSVNLVRLTTDKSLVRDDVSLIDCVLPCYIYISATASATEPDVDVDITVTAVSDKRNAMSPPRPLFEAEEEFQTLAPEESRVFVYKFPRDATALIFSVSVAPAGEERCDVNFIVSTRQDFPDNHKLTTLPAKEVITLDCQLPGTCATVLAQTPIAESPKIYLRTRELSNKSCTFAIAARVAGKALEIHNDDEMEGGVKRHGYDRYRFFVGDAEAHDAEEVAIQVRPYLGKPVVYVACDPIRYPRQEHYTWKGAVNESIDSTDDVVTIIIKVSSGHFHPGWLYVGITSEATTAYAIHIHWGSGTEALTDGVEQTGNVLPGASIYYSLSLHPPIVRSRDVAPLALRVWATLGAVELCISGIKDSVPALTDAGTPENSNEAGHWNRFNPCDYTADAVANGDPEQLRLAALDLPIELFYRRDVTRFRSQALRIRVIGIALKASQFTIQCTSWDAPAATLNEGHGGKYWPLLDALGASPDEIHPATSAMSTQVSADRDVQVNPLARKTAKPALLRRYWHFMPQVLPNEFLDLKLRFVVGVPVRVEHKQTAHMFFKDLHGVSVRVRQRREAGTQAQVGCVHCDGSCFAHVKCNSIGHEIKHRAGTCLAHDTGKAMGESLVAPSCGGDGLELTYKFQNLVGTDEFPSTGVWVQVEVYMNSTILTECGDSPGCSLTWGDVNPSRPLMYFSLQLENVGFDRLDAAHTGGPGKPKAPLQVKPHSAVANRQAFRTPLRSTSTTKARQFIPRQPLTHVHPYPRTISNTTKTTSVAHTGVPRKRSLLLSGVMLLLVVGACCSSSGCTGGSDAPNKSLGDQSFELGDHYGYVREERDGLLAQRSSYVPPKFTLID